jgi:biotin synthase
MTEDLISKSMDGVELTADEIADLFDVPLFSTEAAMIQAAGRRKSDMASGGLAEIHAQVGLSVAPCPSNCKFCAFAACNGVFSESVELAPEEVIARSRQFEADGANAIFLMSTARYPLERFCEIGREVRGALRAKTVLIANVGDFGAAGARRLAAAGFSGIYHAVRMGEGEVTAIEPEKRLKTFAFAKQAGLKLGTCVEPVGPEHTTAELVEKTIITRDAKPSYSGSARRIPIPGTELGTLGLVSEARMAHILAVIRLALGYDIPGNCTHEPNVIGCVAGANLLWAESGSNPRDTDAETEGKRGMTVAECREILRQAEWNVLDGPSALYGAGEAGRRFQLSDLREGAIPTRA